MKKKKSYKKTRVFLDKRPSEFARQHRGLLTLKKAKKSAGWFFRYGALCDSGMPGQWPGSTVNGTKKEKKDFDRPKMIQFAKLIGLNRNLSTFRKFPLQQDGHSSQRQLRLDLGLLVAFRLGEDLENCPKDFDQTWSEVRGG